MTDSPTNRALAGVKVLDFSHLLQGPFATQLLGDMGADIIKVERAGPGDLFRSMTFFNDWVGGTESPCFLAWNRNKRSIALDLKSPRVREILYHIAETADVVVQNFRPGVMDRLGYGYEDFAKINPRIIYASGSGYGESGPYLKRPGQDMLIQGITGLASLTGPRNEPPIPAGAGFADQIGAMNLVYGILSALYHREKTGRGQKVEVSLMAGMMAHLLQEYVTVLNLGRDFERPASGIGHPGAIAPFGIYETRDGYVSIAMSPFATLVEVLKAPDLKAYDDLDTLYDKRDEVWQAVNAQTKKWARADLMEAMLAVDIWCAEVKDIREAANDPQVTHLGLIASYQHPKVGEVKTVAPAVTLSETPPAIDRPAPTIGQHGREILREYGVDEAEIESLIEAGAVTIQEQAA